VLWWWLSGKHLYLGEPFRDASSALSDKRRKILRNIKGEVALPAGTATFAVVIHCEHVWKLESLKDSDQ